jgi:metal-responsive CopG/Arc/MetJ family transcriptional regulator
MARTTKCISLTIPVELYEELEAYSASDQRSLSNVAAMAIKEFLERRRR